MRAPATRVHPAISPYARLLGLVIIIVGGCRSAKPTTIVVFAAASLAEPFRAIEHSYEAAHPDVDVVLNFAGSQLLAGQLLEGAGADVFASADPLTLERVLAERPVLPGSRRVFARNELIAVVPEHSPIQRFEDLLHADVDLLLAGPEVPAGRYAREALDQLGVREAFEAKLVSNEDSVNGVLAKLELGQADAGIVYATDLRRANGLRGLPLPAGVELSASYELAVLADGPTANAGMAFAEFVTSGEGQALLHAHGFERP